MNIVFILSFYIRSLKYTIFKSVYELLKNKSYMHKNLVKLIKGGEVYSPSYLGKKDILIGGDKILQISEHININLEDVEVIDAEGMIVVPGLIDAHVHIAVPYSPDSRLLAMTIVLRLLEFFALYIQRQKELQDMDSSIINRIQS